MGFMAVTTIWNNHLSIFYKKKLAVFPLFFIFMNVYCIILLYDANLQSLLDGIPHHPLAFGI
jgi:hypothetical protein